MDKDSMHTDPAPPHLIGICVYTPTPLSAVLPCLIPGLFALNHSFCLKLQSDPAFDAGLLPWAYVIGDLSLIHCVVLSLPFCCSIRCALERHDSSQAVSYGTGPAARRYLLRLEFLFPAFPRLLSFARCFSDIVYRS